MFPTLEFKGVPIPFFKEIWWTFFLHRYKWAQAPPSIELLLVFSFFIVNPYGDGLSFFSLLSLPQSHTPMSIVEKLFSGKCNMMLFCDHKMFNTSHWDFSNTLSRPDNAALWKIVWFYCRVWFFDYENFLNKKEIILPLIAESILVVSTMFYAWEA